MSPFNAGKFRSPATCCESFERGGEKKPEVGIPSLEEQPGKPDVKLSERGFGTMLRTDPTVLGLQKTRLA